MEDDRQIGYFKMLKPTGTWLVISSKNKEARLRMTMVYLAEVMVPFTGICKKRAREGIMG